MPKTSQLLVKGGKMLESSSDFRSKDLYSAAILRTLNYPLLDLDRSEGSYIVFVFGDPNSSAEEMLIKHWNGQLEVNSRDFIESIRELKTRLHGQR